MLYYQAFAGLLNFSELQTRFQDHTRTMCILLYMSAWVPIPFLIRIPDYVTSANATKKLPAATCAADAVLKPSIQDKYTNFLPQYSMMFSLK